jgi:hypothetical protein
VIKRCAWCKLLIAIIEPIEDTRTTHGICTPCRAQHFPVERIPYEMREEKLQRKTASPLGAGEHDAPGDRRGPDATLSKMRNVLYLKSETCSRCGASYTGFPLRCSHCGSSLRCAGC